MKEYKDELFYMHFNNLTILAVIVMLLLLRDSYIEIRF